MKPATDNLGQTVERATRLLLVRLAAKYEVGSFLEGDPSRFMHLAEGKRNKEATAFVASSLSFGSRAQFLPAISRIVELADGNIHKWIFSGAFKDAFRRGESRCFYRFFTYGAMHLFFSRYADLMKQHGTLGRYVEKNTTGNALDAIKLISGAFTPGAGGVVPKNASSACKRLCMFLRWMTRSGSPVDIGLWSNFIDKATLPIPLDTHVLSQAHRLGLIRSKTASMATAVELSKKLSAVFPKDPAKGDFALFGYGVNLRKQ